MGTLFVILGPTGVGKTKISFSISEMLGCDIISSDSRQIYSETKIGTAAPTEEELLMFKHRFIATRSITQHYSSGQYEIDAIPVIEEEIRRTGNALLVGGSMLYIDAVCRGIDDIPTIRPEVRDHVKELYNTIGLDGIRAQLKLLDPIHYTRVDLMNAKRIMHALEVCLQTGHPFSDLHTGSAKQRQFNIVKIGLNRPREELYERINSRVLQMINDGLEQEAGNLYRYRHLNALNTVGYKEMFNYFDGVWTRDFAIQKIQQNTRHYAKKQLSWFKRDPEITWFHPNENDKIIQHIKNNLCSTLF